MYSPHLLGHNLRNAQKLASLRHAGIFFDRVVLLLYRGLHERGLVLTEKRETQLISYANDVMYQLWYEYGAVTAL